MLRTADKRLFLGQLSDLLGGQSAATPPVAGYNGWWDAAHVDSFTIDTGAVSQWDDLSDSGFHLTQATASLRPTYDVRTINGVVVPEFNGTSQWLGCACPRDDRTSALFAVALNDAYSGVDTIVGNDGSGSPALRTSGTTLLQTSTSGVVMASMSITLVAGTAYTFGHDLTTSDVTQYFDGSSETDANATALTLGRTMRLGQQLNNGEYWDGLIAEVISYPVTLGATDAAAVMSYLRTKWGTA